MLPRCGHLVPSGSREQWGEGMQECGLCGVPSAWAAEAVGRNTETGRESSAQRARSRAWREGGGQLLIGSSNNTNKRARADSDEVQVLNTSVNVNASAPLARELSALRSGRMEELRSEQRRPRDEDDMEYEDEDEEEEDEEDGFDEINIMEKARGRPFHTRENSYLDETDSFELLLIEYVDGDVKAEEVVEHKQAFIRDLPRHSTRRVHNYRLPHWAARRGDIPLLRAITEYEQDLPELLTMTDANGLTPIMYALQHFHHSHVRNIHALQPAWIICRELQKIYAEEMPEQCNLEDAFLLLTVQKLRNELKRSR